MKFVTDKTRMSFAHFSPDGKVVVTAAGYSTQLWDTSGAVGLYRWPGWIPLSGKKSKLCLISNLGVSSVLAMKQKKTLGCISDPYFSQDFACHARKTAVDPAGSRGFCEMYLILLRLPVFDDRLVRRHGPDMEL